MARTHFSSSSFLLRWAVALVLVFATFNPTDYSYFRWVAVWDGNNVPVKALVGIALLIVYVIYFRATWRSIGPIGLTLAAALMAVLVWVTIDFCLLDHNKPTIMTWVLLFAFGTILAIGISWSHIRRLVSGQADMDDVED